MNFHRKHFAAALSLLFCAGAAFAQDAPGPGRFEKRMQARQERQEARIEAGTANGSLTARESERIGRQEARISQAEQKALGDGSLSAKEKAGIEHMQDAESRGIARQKHDRQRDFDHNGLRDLPQRPPR